MGREGDFQTLLLRGGGPNCTIYDENKVPSSLHQTTNFGTDALLCLETMAAQRRVMSKIEAKFHTDPFKIRRERWGEC